MVKNFKTIKWLADYVRQLNKACKHLHVIIKNFKFVLKFTFLFFQGTERIKGQGAPVFQKDLKRPAEFPSQESCRVIASNEPLPDHLCWSLG